MIPKYRPNIIDEIIIDDNVVAHIAGINLKPIKYEDSQMLEEYIECILEIKDESHRSIFIEGIDKTNIDVKRLIENKTSLNFPKGRELMSYNIPIVIRDVSKIMNKDMFKEEVLLMADNREEVLDLINIVGDTFNFISLIGINGQEAEEVYEEVLDKTGISLFQPLDMKKNIGNYGVIINRLEKPDLDLVKIKKNTIIFDQSLSKNFSRLQSHLIIQDVKLDLKDMEIKNHPWICNKISSDLYEGLFMGHMAEYCQISTKDKSYNIEEYINQEIKIKGGL